MTQPNKSPEPTAVGAGQFRYRGPRCESAVAQLFSFGMIEFAPIYQRSVRCALFCQVISVILTGMILDTGLFAFEFLCLSLAFWVIAGILMFKRRHPSVFERAFIASGPVLIFVTMFLVG